MATPDDDKIRPTSDRARLAILNMVFSRGGLIHARVLDLFCGTGAMGLDALSRGADTCLFVDESASSLDLCQKNARALDALSTCTFWRTSAAPLSSPRAQDQPATLVFLDPPYRQGLVIPTLTSLVQGGWLAPHALIVAEAEKEWTGPMPGAYDILAHKTHGAAGIFLLQVKSS